MTHDPTIKFSLDQVLFCGATDCPYFRLCDPPHGVSKSGWFCHLPSYLLACSRLFMFNLHIFITLINMNKGKVLNRDLGWEGVNEAE